MTPEIIAQRLRLGMVERMRERGLPEPELSVEGGHFRVVLRAAPAEGGAG